MCGDEIPCGGLRRLFVAAESNDEIARRHEALRLEPQEGRRQERDFLLDVGSAAAEEKAVLLDELVRIALPVAALRGHHVHVSHEIDGPSAAAAAPVTHDQGCSLAQRQDANVGGGEAAGLEAFGEVLRHQGYL